jgi:hypothetical protein
LEVLKMAIGNLQPAGFDSAAFVYDELLLRLEDQQTEEITLAQDVGATVLTHVRGRMLNKDPETGLWHPLSSTETTVALDATGEVIVNAIGATLLEFNFQLAFPPIPGTVTLATTADGSATVLKALGTDNGLGRGAGADGEFTIDYQSGKGRAILATTGGATNDLKAGYKHRTPALPTPPLIPQGLPVRILAETHTAAVVAAGDVVTVAYSEGHFNTGALVGWSAGFASALLAFNMRFGAKQIAQTV